MKHRATSRCIERENNLEFSVFGGKMAVKIVRYWVWMILAVFIVFILFETIIGRPVTEEYKYNLLPFWSYLALTRGEGVNIWRCIYLNVLLFMPLGALLWFALKDRRWLKVLIFSFALSMSIEIMQLVLRRGLCEFDDVFHNTLGCLLGYWAVGLFARVVDRVRG
jgi:glycopeptide antibiotics resistance protein